MKQLVFLNSGLNSNSITGIDAATLFRTKVFEKVMQHELNIYTVFYNNRSYDHLEKLREQDKISKKVKLYNLYTYYQSKNETTIVKENSINQFNFQAVPGWKVVEKTGTNDLRVYNEKEEKILFIHHDDEGRVSFINTMITSNRVQNLQREWYDEKGYLSKTEIFNLSNDKVLTEIYYSTNGSICITKHFQNEHNKQILKHINLYDGNGRIKQFFSTEEEFIAYWLNELTDCDDNFIFIMERSANYYQALKSLNKSNVKKIGIVHASHLVYGEKHLNETSLEIPLNSIYRDMLEQLNNTDILDRVIILTRRQLNDIENRFGQSKKLVCIPNMLNKEIERVDFSKRKLNKIVMLARYAPVKQHKSAVRVMQYVIDKMPNVVLEMYGNGPEKESVIKLVKELGLQNNIKVNSFANDVSELYNSAGLFILTSLSESFGISILEALSHGVPVVSYDIRYGPDEMIISGDNGYLIKPNDEKQMAEKIIEILNSKDKHFNMCENAYRLIEPFKIYNTTEKWLRLIDDLNSEV